MSGKAKQRMGELAVRFAQVLTRLLTWGMEEEARTAALLESDSDWELMGSDLPPLSVLGRALRGVPATVLGRMDDRHATGLPSAFAMTLIAVAALYAGVVDTSYPGELRVFITFLAIGAGGAGLVLLHSPRRVQMRRLRIPTGATAIGLFGIAFNMPTESEWPYDVPFVDTILGDVLMVTGFLISGTACLLILVATLFRSPRRLLAIAGIAGIAGLVSFASGLIVWGFVATQVDLALTVGAIGAGLGGYSLAHVLPRIRHLDLV